MSEVNPDLLRYVVLWHFEIAEPHFDLLFEAEAGGSLTAWRSGVWPLVDGAQLVRIGQHRRDYLTYEGPVSQGRGWVSRVETGTFERLGETSAGTILRLVRPGCVESWRIEADPTNGDLNIVRRA
jgi:hypothetical protein